MILELCDNETLKEILDIRKYISESDSRYFLLQVLKAVEFIHSNHIIHHDLKLGNIFLKDNICKVGDFGMAYQITSKDEYVNQRRFCGTPNYISPEMLNKTEVIGFEVDIWSLGVMLFAMLFGKPPFQTKTLEETYRRISANYWKFPINNDQVSEDARDLITMILKKYPPERPSINHIISHPFFLLNQTDNPHLLETQF